LQSSTAFAELTILRYAPYLPVSGTRSSFGTPATSLYARRSSGTYSSTRRDHRTLDQWQHTCQYRTTSRSNVLEDQEIFTKSVTSGKTCVAPRAIQEVGPVEDVLSLILGQSNRRETKMKAHNGDRVEDPEFKVQTMKTPHQLSILFTDLRLTTVAAQDLVLIRRARILILPTSIDDIKIKPKPIVF